MEIEAKMKGNKPVEIRTDTIENSGAESILFPLLRVELKNLLPHHLLTFLIKRNKDKIRTS